MFVLKRFHVGGREVNTNTYTFKYYFTAFKEPCDKDGKSNSLGVRRPEKYTDLTTPWLCDVSKSLRIGLKQHFPNYEFCCTEVLEMILDTTE